MNRVMKFFEKSRALELLKNVVSVLIGYLFPISSIFILFISKKYRTFEKYINHFIAGAAVAMFQYVLMYLFI